MAISRFTRRFKRFFAQSRVPAQNDHNTRWTLAEPEAYGRISPDYLSFSIDISVLAGGLWWQGDDRAQGGLGRFRLAPLDLNHPLLNLLAQGLAPSYLRIGGSEADTVHYFTDPTSPQASQTQLTQSQWDALHHFLARHHFKLVFTCRYDRAGPDQHNHAEYTPTGQKAPRHGWEALLAYSQQQGYAIAACELGNELNAYWLFHGLRSQPSGAQLAEDYGHFAKRVHHYYPQAKILGPGSAFWPYLGEALRPVSNLTPRFLQQSARLGTPLQVVDWHFYPFQSRRTPLRTRPARLSQFLRPSVLDSFSHYSRQLGQLRDRYAPTAELWTGETGSAQCGGEPQISSRFVSCLWWADQLGQGAMTGQQVMIRQSLIGGDYGLISLKRCKPRPDYWLCWLWRQLIGLETFRMVSPVDSLRLYGFSLKQSEAIQGAGFVLLAINLDDQAIQVSPPPSLAGHRADIYSLTSKKLTSKKLLINGHLMAVREQALPTLGDLAAVTPFDGTLPAYSVNFWVFRAPAA